LRKLVFTGAYELRPDVVAGVEDGVQGGVQPLASVVPYSAFQRLQQQLQTLFAIAVEAIKVSKIIE